GGRLLGGRVARARLPWIDDHRVRGSVLLPGAALVELALRAAQAAGAAALAELTITAPVPVPAAGALRLQIELGAAEPSGRRRLTIHTQPEDAGDPSAWTEHARGETAPGDLAPGDL